MSQNGAPHVSARGTPPLVTAPTLARRLGPLMQWASPTPTPLHRADSEHDARGLSTAELDVPGASQELGCCKHGSSSRAVGVALPLSDQEHAPGSLAPTTLLLQTVPDARLRLGDLSPPWLGRAQRYRRPRRAATRASGGRVAEAVRYQSRAAPVPALGSLPLREQTSGAAGGRVARSGREQERGAACAGCCFDEAQPPIRR
jgi:hypothetical protein